MRGGGAFWCVAVRFGVVAVRFGVLVRLGHVVFVLFWRAIFCVLALFCVVAFFLACACFCGVRACFWLWAAVFFPLSEGSGAFSLSVCVFLQVCVFCFVCVRFFLSVCARFLVLVGFVI